MRMVLGGKGQYWLRLIGGKNMHHGALTLELDGAYVARVDTYDQPNDLAAWCAGY